MTPTDVLTQARDQYNAVGDSFFTDSALLNWMKDACDILAREAWIIERVYTTTTVASQQAYAYPTNTLAIKRITYNGRKIKRLTGRQDDAATLSNQSAATTGNVVYYTDFNYTIYCRPIPDSAFPLVIYSYNTAQPIVTTSSLEVPEWTHMALVKYLLKTMFAKDQNTAMIQFYSGEWNEEVLKIKAIQRRRMRADSFATVQDEETLPVTIFGES